MQHDKASDKNFPVQVRDWYITSNENVTHVNLQVALQVAAVKPSEYEVVSFVEHIGDSADEGHYVLHQALGKQW